MAHHLIDYKQVYSELFTCLHFYNHIAIIFIYRNVMKLYIMIPLPLISEGKGFIFYS